MKVAKIALIEESEDKEWSCDRKYLEFNAQLRRASYGYKMAYSTTLTMLLLLVVLLSESAEA